MKKNNKTVPLKQQNLDIHRELIVDLFAGGGGKSEGIKIASGRNPDIAINHNDDALSMHRINHPDTRHFVADVFEVDPRTVTQGRPVGHLHASPDCTHHSQAAGGQPRNEKRRALSWVVVRWAGQVSPRVITLENVKQVQQWGPLIAKRDKETGRVIKLDGEIAEPGERVPRELQYLIPDPKHKGRTWNRFLQILRGMGYDLNVQMMRACDYGAGTTRDRLFMHARNDGKPATFPEPTHFKNPKKGQKKWSAAHEHIDFSIEGKSIFDRKKPLQPNTLKRIAKGIKRYVIDNPDPFIVQLTQSSSESMHSVREPLRTVTTAKGGEFAMVSPVMVQAGHGEGSPGGVKRWGDGAKSAEDPAGTIMASGGGQSVAMAYLQQYYGMKSENEVRGAKLDDPLLTQTTENRHAIVIAHLAQMNGGFYEGAGNDARDPMSTITNTGSQQQLVTAFLSRQFGTSIGHSAEDPHGTFTTEGGGKSALVECVLSPDDEAKALRVAAFLMSYYGTDNMSDPRDPLPTVTTKDRLALVTVYYHGTPYVIVDIKLRMLEPKELYSAQGFGPHYIFTHGHDGRKFSKSAQVRMCGNSVSPYPAAALFAECHRDEDMRLVA